MRAGAGGNHPEVPGSRNALFSTSETHAANSRQREPAASRPRRRDVGNLSVGQTAGRGSDLPDRRLNRRQKAGRWHKPHPREAPCPGGPREGAAKGSRPWLFVPSTIPGSGCQRRAPGDAQGMRNARDRAKGNIPALFPGGENIPPGSSLLWGNVVLLTLGVGGRNPFRWNFSRGASRQMKVSRVGGGEVGVYYSHS